jgi:conjugal transfer/type IV secretion protein DotA/TraY
VVNPINTGQMAAGIIDSQVCEMAINETANNLFPGTNPVSRTGPVVENTINPIGMVAHVFQGYQETVSPLPGSGIYATQYSEYQWTVDSGGLLGELSSMDVLPTACGKAAFVSGVTGHSTGASATLVNTVGSENASAIGALIASLHPISANLYGEIKPGTDASNFVKAINTYDTTMETGIQNAANTAVQSQVQAYESAARVDGFATAGEWFWDLVRWNHVAQKTASSLGDATGMNPSSFLGKMLSSHVNNADARVRSFIKENGSLVGHIQPTKNAGGDIGSVFAEATPLLVSAISNTNSNPLIAIRNLGEGMEAAGAAVYAGDALLTGGAAALNGGIDKLTPLAGNATNAAAKVVYYDVTPVLLFLAGLLFVEGFFLSFVVPMIPFMVWIVALLGFLFMAFEMIVAAPLWGIMHMHPEGHEVVGMGAQGYKMALAIITRPFLMILGFIGGYALFMGFTELITPMIASAVVSSQGAGGGWTGPLDMIGAVGIYATLMIIIAYECFKLVFVLPERVMNWASAGVQNYGEGGMVDKQQTAHDKAKGIGNNIDRTHRGSYGKK